jgi:nucleoside phosphorylase
MQGRYHIASVPRVGTDQSYLIAVMIAGQATALAVAATKDAITDLDPKAVVLVGIAAGFPEAGVNLGDILVPFRIVPYELAKIREAKPESIQHPTQTIAATSSRVQYDHRDNPSFDVSHPLWNAAEALSRDAMRPWISLIREPRPPSSVDFPVIHVDRDSKFGSGDKLVASEHAEARQYLLKTYGEKAIGLDTEGYGALIGCRSADKPMVLVKASQDPGTADKDNLATKDLWRRYAAAASAAFVVTLIKTYDFPGNGRILYGRDFQDAPFQVIPAADRLRCLLERNFLFNFDNSGNPDYLRLLSLDYRRLFQHFQHQSRRICISGPEGCGKTFNTLLIAEQFRRDGYESHCVSVRDAGLSVVSLSAHASKLEKPTILLIDDCQDDLDKTEKIVQATRSTLNQNLTIVFLTRPLDAEDHIETFGQSIPTICFNDRFNDFEMLAKLFFTRHHRVRELPGFLRALKNETLSRELYRYRNMEFWNTYFNTVAYTGDFTFDHGLFYERAYAHLRNTEPTLIDPSSGLVRLLPFFGNGLPVLRDWAIRALGVTEKEVADLSSRNLVREAVFDWDNSSFENDTAVFVEGAIHTTKARLASLVASKYGGVINNEVRTVAEYCRDQLPNLYYLVSALCFSSPDLLRTLCVDADFQATLRAYLKQRHLGKHLDRTLTRLARIGIRNARAIIDQDVLTSLVSRLQGSEPFLISKALLLRAIYRLDPVLAHDTFTALDFSSMLEAFKQRSRGAGLEHFSKLIEVLKNIYYAAPGQAEKSRVVRTVRQLLEQGSSTILSELQSGLFGELHWLLKRLDPIRSQPGSRKSLAHELLLSLSPENVTRWICTKNVRVNELRFIFMLGRSLSVGPGNKAVALYPDYFSSHLGSQCLQNILGNRRSKLYDIVITSKFSHELLAKELVLFAQNGGLTQKVSQENNIHRINECIGLLEGRLEPKPSPPIHTISVEQRAFLIRCIIESASLTRDKIRATKIEARSLGRDLNIDREVERFRATAAKYGVQVEVRV